MNITKDELHCIIEDAAISPTKLPAFFVPKENCSENDDESIHNIDQTYLNKVQINLDQIHFDQDDEAKSPPRKRICKPPITGVSIIHDAQMKKK